MVSLLFFFSFLADSFSSSSTSISSFSSSILVFTRDWFHQMLSMLNLNSISISKNSLPIGKGFYRMASFFNHSCLPNIGGDFDGSKIAFTVAQDVSAGDQLFISYVNNSTWSQKENHEFLWMHYGFKCECTLCQQL